MRVSPASAVVIVLAGAAVCAPLREGARETAAEDARGDSARRLAALRHAQVWAPPAVPIGRADLTANPPGPPILEGAADVQCRFVVTRVGGATPKFECVLPDSQRVKVRYGEDNPEIPAELAATRLMTALGFPTDRLYAVRSVMCQGCPRYPFLALRCYRRVPAEWLCMPFRSRTRVRQFAPVVVEVRYPGREIASEAGEGWAWYELDEVRPPGAPRAHVDALRLMAVLLAHWDNKADNQRLACAPGSDRPDGSCARPIAMIKDLGGSFGPFKMDLKRWASLPVWADPRACAVSMESMPFEGGTFPPGRVSEAGRRMAAGLLSQLTGRQIRDLFSAAGFRDPDAWARVFARKVEEIKSAGPCPPSLERDVPSPTS